MHPAAEPLIQRKPKCTAPYNQPPLLITYTGYERRRALEDWVFRTTIYDKNPKLFEPLKISQSPKYIAFACSDSCVCPTLTLGLKPGQTFTIRNISAMVPAYHETRRCSIGSAIEFAMVVLKVECIVVIGHSCCGGIRELSLKEDEPHAFHFIEDWVKIGLDAKKVQRENMLLPFDDQCTVLEMVAVNVSLINLKSYPFVKERLAKGTLNLISARYNFVYGNFEIWDA